MIAHVMMAESLPDLAFRQSIDPDAQATVTDFIDYTELFPSDLIRSLTLIGKLDQTYKDAAAKVHDLTKVLGILPTLPTEQRPDPETLRAQISQQLNRATACREASLAESTRMVEVAERHAHRLSTIKRKLQDQPRPPSRDATPAMSPQMLRAKKQEDKKQRLAAHIDGLGHGLLKSQQQSRIIVPGEVLPPGEELLYNVVLSDIEDDFSRAASPDVDRSDEAEGHEDTGRVRIPKGSRLPKIKIPKLPRPPRERGERTGRVFSTGISTSAALALLTPPPPDAKVGSKHRPWGRLTEYEFGLLRKSMKKNSAWRPSETMIRKELIRNGRTWADYEKAKTEAEARGETVLNEPPDELPVVAPLIALPVSPELTKTERRPSTSNASVTRTAAPSEAKKPKKEKPEERKKEGLEEVIKRIGASNDVIRDLFKATPKSSTPGQPQNLLSPLPTPLLAEGPRTSKKRKREKSKELTPVNVKPPPVIEQGVPALKKRRFSTPVTIPPAPVSATFSASSALSPAKTDIITKAESSALVPPTILEGSTTPSPKTRTDPQQYSSPAATAGAIDDSLTPVGRKINQSATIDADELPTPKPVFHAGTSGAAAEEPVVDEMVDNKSNHLDGRGIEKVDAEPTKTEAMDIEATVSEPIVPESASIPHTVPVAATPATAAHSRPKRTVASRNRSPTSAPSVETAAAESIVTNKEATSEPLAPRTRSRGSTLAASVKAASAEPPTSKRETRQLRELRRSSVMDVPPIPLAPPMPEPTGRVTRGSRKPAPGIVAEDEDNKGKVSIAKRRNAPKKKGAASSKKDDEKEEEVEDIDPNEPRYCLCNDVSYGKMIACENSEVCRFW